MEPPVFLALPRFFSKRIDETTGKFSEAGNSKDIINRASKGEPSDGVFIDVGGWIGDSSFPSAALGFDTYVFEPVRYNVDLMHIALTTNNCTISHLLIVNALDSTMVNRVYSHLVLIHGFKEAGNLQRCRK